MCEKLLHALSADGILTTYQNSAHHLPPNVRHYLCHHQHVIKRLLLPLDIDAHKMTFGHVAVVEGHRDFLGASRLAALAAMKTGAGLVTIMSKDEPKNIASDYAEFIKADMATITPKRLGAFSALVIGPGLGHDEAHAQWAATVVPAVSQAKCVVIDADGLRLISNNQLTLANNVAICTPHIGEAARLLDIPVAAILAEPYEAMRRLTEITINGAQATIWLLKSSITLMGSKDGPTIVFCGRHPMLATAGSGDVLSGSIAGLLSQTACPTCAVMVAISLQINSAFSMDPHRSMRGVLASELCHTFPTLLARCR